MKSVLLIVIACVVVSNAFFIVSDSYRKKIKEECIQEHQIDYNYYINKGVDFQNSDRKYRCFGACMIVKMGLFNEKGDPSMDLLMDVYFARGNPSRLNELKNCIYENSNKSDVCDKLVDIANCLNSQNWSDNII